MSAVATHAGERGARRRDLLWVLALVVIAALARLPTLAEQSFWLDEAYTEHLVRMSLGAMLHAIPRSESTPPVYYVLAWGWTRVLGHSEFALRSLSALAGILTVPVTYALALRLAGRRAAVIAGLLLALSPLLIWYSQEARAYALATLLGTVSLTCFVAFLDTRRGAWLAVWAAASALGLATHYFVAFVVGPELVWLLWRRRQDRRVLAAAAAVLAVAAALVPLALAQRGTGHADYIAQGSLTTRLAQIPKQFLTGYASPSQLITSVLAAALCASGAAALLLGSANRERRRAAIPLTVGLACVLIPVVLALLGVDFVNTRNVLPALPPLLVVVAIGFATLAKRTAALALTGTLAAVLIAVVAIVDTNPRYQRDDWRGVSDALGRDLEPRAIVVTPGSGLIALGVYQPGLRRLGQARVGEIDVVAIPGQVLGGGIGAPPRPRTPAPPAPGFRLTRTVYGKTYTVLRFTAPQPVPVTAAGLAPAALLPGPVAVLTERPAPLH
ncbi:MAG TPA: glycosyltransferase family 39 protein [Solirubrobacteraceae bacterium]|nr:glycosyltransferase family 39 protein [Solirubrobacteraceae bacterium]